jgi:hypothetical protein
MLTNKKYPLTNKEIVCFEKFIVNTFERKLIVVHINF